MRPFLLSNFGDAVLVTRLFFTIFFTNRMSYQSALRRHFRRIVDQF
jgi:hypothetical protein